MFELEAWKTDNRPKRARRSSAEALQGLPAHMLLNRLDRATIVIGLDGVVVYANPACERLLGYQTALTLEGQSLATLLTGQSNGVPRELIERLCDPDTVTNWNHSDGYPVATLTSDPTPLRMTDLMLMVSLEDVSDQMWSEVDRAFRLDPQRGK